MVTYLHKLMLTFDSKSLSVADTILEGLEQMGMMPPLKEEEIIYDNEPYVSFTYKWEDEDEKK